MKRRRGREAPAELKGDGVMDAKSKSTTMDAKGKATLTYGGDKTLDFPVYGGTIGPDVIDIRALYGKTGMFTYDPGFLSTASCRSTITYIDGDAGVLLYRGYPDRAARGELRFPRGVLPAAERRAADAGAEGRVRLHGHAAHDGARAARAPLFGVRRDSHPMAVMVGVVGALSAFYHDSLDINNPEHREISPSASSRSCRRSWRWPTSTTWASRSCTRRTTSGTRPTSCA
jgi:citrate synthase